MIRLENVIKTYKGADAPALDSVSLDIQRGEFVFLVGTSGSGKSTLLRLMLREERVDQGEVLVLGENLSQLSASKVAQFRRKLGVVFQDFRLLPNKTVYQNVAFALQVLGKPKAFIETAVPDVLELVGLSQKADRLPSALSGGEQQRVAIARALVNRPEVLLADEPTGNLDPATSNEIMTLLDRINLAGTTIVMATHDRGIVVSCQNEKSQLQNKAAALRVLQSRLLLLKKQEEDAKKKELAGDVKASWGEQMRSYVLAPYQMVKDLRNNYEVNNPDAVFDGEIEGFISAGLRWRANPEK